MTIADPGIQPEFMIAVVSGVITLFASLVVAIYQSRVEFRKLSSQLEEKYTTTLFDRRLQVYPLLSRCLISLSSAIERNQQSKQQLLNFQGEVDDWLASYGMFLTQSTSKVIWGYHNYLIELLDQYREAEIPDECWIEMRNFHIMINAFLRAELGVYDMKPAGVPELEKDHIKQAISRLEQSSDRMRERFYHTPQDSGEGSNR